MTVLFRGVTTAAGAARNKNNLINKSIPVAITGYNFNIDLLLFTVKPASKNLGFLWLT